MDGLRSLKKELQKEQATPPPPDHRGFGTGCSNCPKQHAAWEAAFAFSVMTSPDWPDGQMTPEQAAKELGLKKPPPYRYVMLLDGRQDTEVKYPPKNCIICGNFVGLSEADYYSED